MRWLAFVLGVGACGRIEFDGLGDASMLACAASWQRQAEWLDGAVDMSSVGNPSVDSVGRPVWHYEVIFGGDRLGSAQPWYGRPSMPMVWDVDWFNTGMGAWVHGDDLNPPADRRGMVHTIRTQANFDYTPRVRWRNPLAVAADLAILGDLSLAWDGDGTTMSSPIPVDVAIVKLSTDLLTASVLWSDTFDKPTADSSEEQIALPPVDLRTTIAPGESIALTLRAASMSSPVNSWMYLGDSLTLTATTCPP